MATHKITINRRNSHHWAWSLNGGVNNVVMASNSAEIDAPDGGTVNVAARNSNNVVLATDSATLDAPSGGGGIPVSGGTSAKLDGFVYKLTGSAWASMQHFDGSIHDIQNKQILIFDNLRINSRTAAVQADYTGTGSRYISSCLGEFDFGSWNGNTNTWTTEYQSHKNLIWGGEVMWNTWDEMGAQAHFSDKPGFDPLRQSTSNQDFNPYGIPISVYYHHDQVLGTRMGYTLWGETHNAAYSFPSWMPVGGHNPNVQEFVLEGHPLPVAHSSIRAKGQGIRFYKTGYLSFRQCVLWNNNTAGNPIEVGSSAFQDVGYNSQYLWGSTATMVRPFSDLGGLASLNSYNEFIAASDNWLEQNIIGTPGGTGGFPGDRSMQFVATVNLDEVQPDVWDYGISTGPGNLQPSSPVKTKLQTIPAGLDWYYYPYVWPTYTR